MTSVAEKVGLWFAVGLTAWLGLRPSDALANGRFPGADQLVVDPRDPLHLLVRATFGFVETRDAGENWHWICEEIVGQIGTADPSIAITGDGSIVVAVPFNGVAVSHDGGCTWSRAPAPLAGQLAVDSTLDPSDPAGLFVLTSTNDPGADAGSTFEFLTLVVETKDNARTWNAVGTALPRDFIATTIEVAPSDPDRFYVGGVVGVPPAAAIERSVDHGQTWSRTMVPADTAVAGLFVSAIDPLDPDRVWVRVASPAIDTFGTSPTTLLTSGDRGDHWMRMAATRNSMLGFALSPDGARLAYGGADDGVFVGPSDGSGAFAKVSAIKDRALTWSAAGLYASATEPFDPFAVGLSRDMGHSFEPVYHLAATCPQACPDSSPFDRVCRDRWTDMAGGVASLTGATGQACSVAWGHVAGAADGGVEGAANPDDGGSSENFVEPSGGCRCELSSQRAGRASPIALMSALAFLAGTRRRAGLKRRSNERSRGPARRW